jgi:hypothetical protein
MHETLSALNGGYVEIDARLAIAEMFACVNEMDEARVSLTETLQRIDERAADIPDGAARCRYLENVPENKLSRELSTRWLG